jgi:hypothetical protein
MKWLTKPLGCARVVDLASNQLANFEKSRVAVHLYLGQTGRITDGVDDRRDTNPLYCPAATALVEIFARPSTLRPGSFPGSSVGRAADC